MSIPKTAQRLSLIRSDIRGPLYEEALRMEREGKKVLKLNTGNPASFGFTAPESVRRALTEEMERATAYCDVKGMKNAREAILSYHLSRGLKGIREEDVFLSNGVSEMVQMITLATLEPGDQILLPCPNYSLWENCAHLAGAKPVFYRCDEENGWIPDVDDIQKKITRSTRAILVINPNNPTGAIYPEAVLKQITRLAEEHGLMIFSDEIYDRLIIDPTPFVSTASLSENVLCVTFNGLSKSHIVCGWRSGWSVLSGPEEKKKVLREALMKLASMRLCAGALPQLTVPAALADPHSTQSMLIPGGRLYEQRETTCSVLESIDGIDFVKNHAAFYLFPKLDKEKFGIVNDTQFALDLLHAKGVLIIPGSGFAHPGNDHFRIVMLPEKEVLKKAMTELGDFLSGYKQK
ncbi:MAG: aminotransferase class I/II-fold pyridoxal phosphate-dependent enzyme [Ruminococcaceae bacterium]|nr:aminotransferase class I/II-fold pyridoxal phosphate-dependent enzyme [Oscillospiraceae bacterium]